MQDDLGQEDDMLWDDDGFGASRLSNRPMHGGNRWGRMRGFDSSDDDF